MPFDIIICGAGLGGLSAAIALSLKGHKVTVLEAASKLAEVGAGIQIPPNSSRILKHYGIYEEVEKLIVSPRNIYFHRYSTGDVISRTPLYPTMMEKYRFPYWLIHRADYQKCLWNRAAELGVQLHLNSSVTAFEDTGRDPSVTLADGSVMTAHIIIGADGIRSPTRKFILGSTDVDIEDSPNCAYRAIIPMSQMRLDPETKSLVHEANSDGWAGPRGHIMAYPIRGGKMYNLVMSCPGRASVGKWNEPGDLDEMKRHYADYHPIMRKVISKVEYCLKWKLADLPPLPRWVSEAGRVVIIGDAAHAMLPYIAQGAAMAVEDGAALAECLDKCMGDWTLIAEALRAFERIRKPRCEIVQRAARWHGHIWHLPDGPEQRQRDRDMMAAPNEQGGDSAKPRGNNPNQWSNEKFQPWLLGYDTIFETKKALDIFFKYSPVSRI